MSLAALVLAGLALSAPAGAAQASTPCWKQLLNDWYDGRIDNTYQVRCYREAIRNLPEDVDAYTEAREDIERALLAAIRSNGGELSDDDYVPPQTGPRDPVPGGVGGDDGDDAEAAPGSGTRGGGPIDVFRPSNVDEVPLPLLVLAGLALVLLAAAGAGFVARRVQARRMRVAPLQQRSEPPDRLSP
jgi:hypothetical protein